MPALNRVFLIGKLGRDVELRYTPKGVAVAKISLEVNRVWTDDEGQKHEESVFADVALWGRLAEIALKFLHKGSPVFIQEQLQLETWEDKATGQKRSRLYVVGEDLQLLDRVLANRKNAAAAASAGTTAADTARSAAAYSVAEEQDDGSLN
jgi:single-strand DNA-binding protein